MPDIPDNLTASQRITFACPKCGHMVVRTVGTLYHSSEVICSECIGWWDAGGIEVPGPEVDRSLMDLSSQFDDRDRASHYETHLFQMLSDAIDLRSRLIVLQRTAQAEQVRSSLEELEDCCSKTIRELEGTLLEGIKLESAEDGDE